MVDLRRLSTVIDAHPGPWRAIPVRGPDRHFRVIDDHGRVVLPDAGPLTATIARFIAELSKRLPR